MDVELKKFKIDNAWTRKDGEMIDKGIEYENTRLQPVMEQLTKANFVLLDVYYKAKALRAAQKVYMENRGNDALGKLVAAAATELDDAMEKVGK